ncbi:hypothetical protein [Caballeronia sp. DA-9]|uniref:hypothetical protein n=1 Tax=Caballeronia sp. DA-9 TaxID=3436237 RepID=UPI003F67185F
MNAPLVVVQGDLLLPTLYPLAGMPNAVYGEEWTLTRARPALTEYEIPFYAARFLTAYVSPLSLPNEHFPYTPASLWGKFKRNDEIAQIEQNPLADSVHASPSVEEPAQFEFEPFTAPVDHPVQKQPANDRHKMAAGGAIALACAAFIAWALFGTRIGHQSPEVKPATVALNATPVAKPMADATIGHASPVVPPVSMSAALDSSASVATSAKPSTVVVAALPALQTPSATTVAKPAAVIAGATAKSSVHTSEVASDNAKTTAKATAERASKPRLVAQAQDRERAKVRVKGKRPAAVVREARNYEVVQRRHGHEYRGTPVYRSSGYDTPLASPSRRTYAHDDMRTSSTGSSLSVAEMYSMLAHSAVLDDNSGATRQTVRATSVATPRAGSGDSSNWSSDLSQRRVTDAGSQFAK